MGLRDKLTDLREQAQGAVAEHKDQIQNAMESAGAAVDQKTHGKYTDKITRYGQKASDAVEKFSDKAPGERDAAEHPGAAAQAPPAATPDPGTAGS
jgi:MT0933-like antitoxin protein